MFIQEAISDSPFYSTSIQYDHSCTCESNEVQKLPPIAIHPDRQGSSLPTLIMTDDGGDDWEVLSEVT